MEPSYSENIELLRQTWGIFILRFLEWIRVPQMLQILTTLIENITEYGTDEH